MERFYYLPRRGDSKTRCPKEGDAAAGGLGPLLPATPKDGGPIPRDLIAVIR
jgi:hypothetical protein